MADFVRFAGVFVLSVFLGAGWAAAATLSGSVDAVRGGGRIVLLVDGDLLPRAGDRVRVIDLALDGKEREIGTWLITAIESDLAVAEPEQVVEEARVGQRVTIDSTDPQPRTRKPGDDPWLDSLADASSIVIGDLSPRHGFDEDGRAAADAVAVAARRAALIEEWLRVAEPPENGQPGYDLRYTPWAQRVGRTPTGIITATAKPDNVGGRASTDYLWQEYPDLPSLNHCTLSEYVNRRLAGEDIAGCRGAVGTAVTGTVGGAVQRVGETEPNNNGGEATLASANADVSGQIAPRNDADFFRVAASHQGELAIKLLDAPSELDMAVRVWGARGNVVRGWKAAPGNGRTFETFADLAAPGDYFVEVRDGANSASSGDSYRFAFRFTPTADAGEPNDSGDRATPLSANGKVEANILPRNDADFYVVTVDHQGELALRFAKSPENLDMALRVWGDKGKIVRGWKKAPGNGKPLATFADLATPGKYVVEVRDGANSDRSKQPYRLETIFTPTADAGEPNDSGDKATPLALGQVMRANIMPRNDADYYRLEARRAGPLRVAVSEVPIEIDIAVRLWGENGVVVMGWKGTAGPGEPLEAVADLPGPGRYFLEVRDGGNSARSSQPYVLTVLQ